MTQVQKITKQLFLFVGDGSRRIKFCYSSGGYSDEYIFLFVGAIPTIKKIYIRRWAIPDE